MSKNINNQNEESKNNEVVIITNRQIKARFRKNHIAKLVKERLSSDNNVAHFLAEEVNLLSVNQFDNFTWGDKPAPHTEVTVRFNAEQGPVVKSFRLYQDGPRANRLVTAAKKDREMTVESIDSFILDLITDTFVSAKV